MSEKANVLSDVYVQIGLVTLIGLAAKNAILIVEFARDKQENERLSVIDAAMVGAQIRFRPILMTSLAFIFGTLPLVFATGPGANSRHSLGTGVVGGMSAATVLGVFFIPVLYVLFARTRERRRSAGPGAQPPGEPPAVTPAEPAVPAGPEPAGPGDADQAAPSDPGSEGRPSATPDERQPTTLAQREEDGECNWG